MSAKPTKGTLYNPAMGQNLETLDVVRSLDDLQTEFSYYTEVPNPLKQLSGVSTVRPDKTKPQKAFLGFS